MIDQSSAYRQYTPLKATQNELFLAIKDWDRLYPPTPLVKRANKLDRNKLYKFHDTHGHTITQYHDLEKSSRELSKELRELSKELR